MNFAAQNANARYFTVYGEGIGEKARQLMSKAQPILDSGFALDRRNVLGWSFFSDFLKRCGAEGALVDKNVQTARKLIIKGKFNDAELKVIMEICKDLCEYQVLAVRSSAEGDANGTGVYDSFYTPNRVENVCAYAKMVLASHFIEKAAWFRQTAKVGEGMGVMIEPLVADEVGYSTTNSQGNEIYVKNGAYAPIVSGMGRTHSYAAGGPYIGLVQGFAKNFVNDPRYGMIITKENLRYNLSKLRNEKAYLSGPKSSHHMGSFSDRALVITNNGKLVEARISSPIDTENIEFGDVFENINKLHKNCGDIPQYFEYATNIANGKPTYHITQIADDPRSNFIFEPCKDSKLVLGQAWFVLGGGARKTSHLVHIREERGWARLGRINNAHDSYVLIFTDTTIGDANLEFSCANLSNAAVIGEHGSSSADALRNFGAHFGGVMSMVNKILLAFPTFGQAGLRTRNFSDNASAVSSFDGGVVYEIPLKTVASEKMQYGQLLLDK